MRTEYETIVNSGLLLSVDCPDLAMGRHIKFRGVDDDADAGAALYVAAALQVYFTRAVAESSRA